MPSATASATSSCAGNRRCFKLKEEFPFVTGDDDDAFSVKAGGIMDIAGNYAITDAGTGEEVVVLDEDYSLLAENWTIRDPDTGRRWRPFARRINCSLRSATSSPLRTSFRTSTRYSTPTATTSATSREVLAARRLHGHYRRRERRAEGGGNRLRVRPRRLREPVATRVVSSGTATRFLVKWCIHECEVRRRSVPRGSSGTSRGGRR